MFRPSLAAIAASALVGIAGVAGVAAAQSPANPSPAAVQAGAYGVEPAHTRVMFSLSHMGFSTYYGEFTGASGSLTIDPKNPRADAISVSVPTASVSTSNATLNEELKGDKWFDAAKFDTISFRSTRVIPTSDKTADVVGELTIHGVTRPVTLKASFNAAGVNPLDKGYTVGFEVSGDIKRSDFGVSTYVPLIGDDVHLIISAAFEKKAS